MAKGKPSKAKKKPQTNTLLAEANTMLRIENRRLIIDLRRAKAVVAAAENQFLNISRVAFTAEIDREVLYDALRVLAENVDNKTAAGRNARQLARTMLEDKKIKPPSTLGTSRKRPNKKRSLKKK